MDEELRAAQDFLDALLRLDFTGLEAALDPKVEFRALVPGELVNVRSASEVVQCFRRWLGDKTGLELLHRKIEKLIDRVVLEYRLHLQKGEQRYVVEQRAFCNVDGGKIAVMDLICSGLRPEGVAQTEASVHRFDSSDLGCGSGLPREFRARLTQIPVGHILEVVTKDPSAKEDLPSLSRLLGHKVLSVEAAPEGKFIIRVERAK